MKQILLISLFLTSCAHSRIVTISHDKMTVCGNSYAVLDDLVYTAKVGGCENPVAIYNKSYMRGYAVLSVFDEKSCVRFVCK